MNKKTCVNILKTMLKMKRPVNIFVYGDSMFPAIHEGDSLTIKLFDEYDCGDIVVFPYKEGKLIVHRIIKKDDKNYYCKGDNSFRLEDVPRNDILGKVIQINNLKPSHLEGWKLEFSYRINRLFIQKRYDISAVKEHSLYLHYKNIVLHDGRLNMKYQANKKYEYIQTGEETLAIFDSDTCTTILLNEIATDILHYLKSPRTYDELSEYIKGIYYDSDNMIDQDLQMFLTEALENNIIITI